MYTYDMDFIGDDDNNSGTDDESQTAVVETTDTASAYVAKQEAKERARLASRPNLDGLPDAVVRDDMGRMVLLTRPGERLIVERFATILPGRPWLDTKVYTVSSIDEVSGVVHLWDDALQRQAMTNYIDAIKQGYRLKLTARGMNISSQRKRGRPKKIKLQPTQQAEPQQEGEKRGRGRPKGAKNRTVEVRQAEKRAKMDARAVKRAKKVKA